MAKAALGLMLSLTGVDAALISCHSSVNNEIPQTGVFSGRF